MASGFYLSGGGAQRSGAYNNGFFYSWNQWFERHFGRIVGDGFGVRNWFGPSREGDWTDIDPKTFDWGVPFFFLGLLPSIFLALDEKTLTIGVIYFIFSILAYTATTFNYFNKYSLFEGIGTDPKNISKKHFLHGLIILTLWLGISYFISIVPQQIIGLTVLGIISTIFTLPMMETVVLGHIFIPSTARYTGIVPAIFIIGTFIGLLHGKIFNYNLTQMVLSALFSIMLYPLILKWRDSTIIYLHMFANTLITILSIICMGSF